MNAFDNGGRRAGFDRRQFSYSTHVPERRSGKDRRSGTDRRDDRIMEVPEERRAFFQYNFAAT